MKIQIIQVPYDAAHKGLRMGGGPEHFVKRGLPQVLSSHGHQVQVESIEARSSFLAEIKTAFELYRLLAERVGAAVEQGYFPLVLSGNCNSALGTLAGVDPAQVGIIWFDGHADFNTPETTTVGSLDGMGLAIATGRCWRKLAATILGFVPISEVNVLLVGVRDIDPAEKELLEQSELTLVGAEMVKQQGVQAALAPGLAALQARVQRIYLHLDLDVLDPEEAMANEFAPPDGLTVEQMAAAIEMIKERFTVCAGGVASYDPAYDEQGKTLRAGFKLMERLTTASRE